MIQSFWEIAGTNKGNICKINKRAIPTMLILFPGNFPETNIAPKKWMVGILVFLLGWPIFRCELLVSGSVTSLVILGWAFWVFLLELCGLGSFRPWPLPRMVLNSLPAPGPAGFPWRTVSMASLLMATRNPRRPTTERMDESPKPW